MSNGNENYIEINLPSKCLVYKDIDPTKIKLRTLKGKDEKLIAELNLDNFEKRVLILLRSILQGIDPTQLTSGDRLYIMVWEGINSYSKNYEMEGICGECFQKITVPVDLSQLEVTYLPDNFKEPYQVKLSDGGTVNLKLFRVEDEIKIADYEKGSDSSWLYRFALSIVDDSKGIWDKVSYLENLPAKDVATIRAFHEKFAHGPKLETKYTCPKCGGEGVMPIPFRLQMFCPYGETLTRYFGDRI